MIKFSDLSVEIGHLYVSELQLSANATSLSDSACELINLRIDSGYAAVLSTINKYRDHRKSVSTVILIDDYFLPQTARITREEIANQIQESCQRSSIPLDYIVYESALADDVAMLHGRLMPFPSDGAGSSKDNASGMSQWLSNGQFGRGTKPVSTSPRLGRGATRRNQVEDKTHLEALGARAGYHSLHIDIELYKDERDKRKWACPILAAWWQLVRLGMLRDSEGNPCYPGDTVKITADHPLFAKRTLTALSPEFLAIEAAVRTILAQVSVPEQWLKQLREGKDRPRADEHLSRIAYAFVADQFHPIGLRESDQWE